MPRFRVLLLTVIGIAAVLADAAPAHAIPAFARRYGVTCNLCHDPAPRLNAFGEQFAANGFEFVPGEPPRDTIDTGDDLLRLLRRIDFAFRFDAYVTAATPLKQKSTRWDLQTPYLIKLLSGGPIAEKISYYLYFFLGERGEVTGLEDAYVQFTDIGGSGVSAIVGQFQVSDPLFKRELRLEYEDYQPYRMRVGRARADLTYDRGLFLTYSPWKQGDLSLQIVNGRGLESATGDRFYDRDSFKNVALHYSHDLGLLRVGGFGYWGRESNQGERDRIWIWGPDVTLAPSRNVELNLQYLRRQDSNPFFEPGGASTAVNSAFGEVVWSPRGPDGRWYVTGLYNWIDADAPVVSLRLGEQDAEVPFVERYQTASAGVHYLLRRNVRVMGEAGWNFERDRPRLTTGIVLAW